MNVLIFTSLDDSMLDHGTYSYHAAQAALDHIRRRIPLIFTTSKTRLEIERLQSELSIREPFIAENGAAVFFPDGYRNFKIDTGFHSPPYTVIHLGATCSEIRRFVFSVKERFGIKGFGNMRNEEIESMTGLSPEQVLLAKQREFTEPFVIEGDTRIEEMAPYAASRGFKITSGKLFHYLAGIRQDKGRAVRLCTGIFEKNMGDGLMTIGLGDSPDDFSLLENVHVPILLPHSDGSLENFHTANLTRANEPGGKGWSDAILSALNRLEIL